MSLTYTPPSKLGAAMPEFSLPSVQGETKSSADFSNKKGLVVLFICNHCPYVKAIEDRLISLGQEYKDSEVAFVAICSNDPKDYEEDSFENLKKRALEKDYPFPYLFDESQSVAKSFDAVCTPDIFVFKKNQLYYRGRLDDSWKNPENVQNQELKNAIEGILADQQPPENQVPSMGCSIKWKED